jgi:hypothetical protein
LTAADKKKLNNYPVGGNYNLTESLLSCWLSHFFFLFHFILPNSLKQPNPKQPNIMATAAVVAMDIQESPRLPRNNTVPAAAPAVVSAFPDPEPVYVSSFYDWANYLPFLTWEKPVDQHTVRTGRDILAVFHNILRRGVESKRPCINIINDGEPDDSISMRAARMLWLGSPDRTDHLHSEITVERPATKTKPDNKDVEPVLTCKRRLARCLLPASSKPVRRLTYVEYQNKGGAGPEDASLAPQQSAADCKEPRDDNGDNIDMKEVLDVLAVSPTWNGYRVLIVQCMIERLTHHLIVDRRFRDSKWLIVFISGSYNAEWTPGFQKFLEAFPGSVSIDVARVEMVRTTPAGAADPKWPKPFDNMNDLLTNEDRALWQQHDPTTYAAFRRCNAALNSGHGHPDKLFKAGQGPLAGKDAAAGTPEALEYKRFVDLYSDARAKSDFTGYLQAVKDAFPPDAKGDANPALEVKKFKILSGGDKDSPLADCILALPFVLCLVPGGVDDLVFTAGTYGRAPGTVFTKVSPLEHPHATANCFSLHVNNSAKYTKLFHDAILTVLLGGKFQFPVTA